MNIFVFCHRYHTFDVQDERKNICSKRRPNIFKFLPWYHFFDTQDEERIYFKNEYNYLKLTKIT